MGAGKQIKTIASKILWKLGFHDSAGRLGRYNFVATSRSKLRDRWLRVKGAPDGLPIPPPDLIFAVAGGSDVNWFIQGGFRGAESIHEVLLKNGIELLSVRRVLDLGCGCGRVIRHVNFLPQAELTGTDYNPKLIEWCRANLALASFDVNQLEPPLSYDNDTFNLVYALSVFTHLPEKEQLLWMDELRRVIKAGGLLLITLHGEYYLDRLSPAERARFKDGQLVVQEPQVAGSNDCGAFHPIEYVRDMMVTGFEVVDFIAEGAAGNPFQDLYLLRKKPDSVSEAVNDDHR